MKAVVTGVQHVGLLDVSAGQRTAAVDVVVGLALDHQHRTAVLAHHLGHLACG